MEKTILIYAGHTRVDPLYSESAPKNFGFFRRASDYGRRQWHIEMIQGEALESRLKTAEVAKTVLVLPPAESSRLDKAFSASEISLLKCAVEEGLQLFATCGSAYWLAKERFWHGERKEGVGLFLGRAIGPRVPYQQGFQQVATPVTWERGVAHLLLSGGGELLPEGKAEVLATYTGTQKIAALSSGHGKGRMTLLMVHLEYGKEEIDPAFLRHAFPNRPEDWSAIRTVLSDREERYAFLLHCIDHAG